MRRALLMLAVLVGACSGIATGASPASISGASLVPVGWTAGSLATASWSESGFYVLGSRCEVQVNLADDGSTNGRWQTRYVVPDGPREPGQFTGTFSIGDLEGRHAVRVVSPFVHGVALVAGVLEIDRTPPAVSEARITVPAPTIVEVSWSQQDAASGTDPERPQSVEINGSPDGNASEPWVAFSEPGIGDGRASRRIVIPPFAPGRHLVRVRTADRVGNVAIVSIGTVVVDNAPPLIQGLRVVRAPSAANPTVEVAYMASDGGSGIAEDALTTLSGPGGAPVFWQGRQGEGQRTIQALLPGPATHSLVVRVTDRNGNVGESAPVRVEAPAPTEPGVVVVTPEAPPGAASPTRPVRPALRLGRLSAAFVGRRPAGGTIRFGRSVTVAGRLRRASGRALARAAIQVRDDAGHLLATSRTDPGGRFRVALTPLQSGRLRIGVARSRGLVEPASGPRLSVTVRPRIALRVSSRRAVAGGGPVVFTGRIAPSPALLGGSPSKAIVLEWVDPLRRVWRPVLNATVGRDGRFRLSWRFGAGARGFRVPMRVTVPEEIGWPLAPVASRQIAIQVR